MRLTPATLTPVSKSITSASRPSAASSPPHPAASNTISETRSGKIDIRIAADSIDTGFKPRDDVLRSADWFNVSDFPDILFRSQHLIFNER